MSKVIDKILGGFGSDDKSDYDAMKGFFELALKIFGQILRHPKGISLLSVLSGVGLKNQPLRIKPEFRNEDEKWLWDTTKGQEGLVTKFGEDRACKQMSKETRELTCYRWDPVLDLLPIDEIFGLRIPKELGEMKLSDALIITGLIGLAGGAEGIKSIREAIL